jgi:hypothetical protein
MALTAVLIVIAGLDPAIHELSLRFTCPVDARVEPGHDEER